MDIFLNSITTPAGKATKSSFPENRITWQAKPAKEKIQIFQKNELNSAIICVHWDYHADDKLHLERVPADYFQQQFVA
jgi:hypothetical protein